MKEQNGFHKLRINQKAKIGGFKIDPSFLENLWYSLELWLNQIADSKTKKKQARVIRFFDLWIYSTLLKQLLDSQKPIK